MQQKIPRTLASDVRRGLEGEQMLAGSMVIADPAKPALTLILVTPTRLVQVEKKSIRSWRLSEIAVTDYQVRASGQLAAIGILAGEEVVRFLVGPSEPTHDLHEVFRQLRVLDNAGPVATVSEMPWWERKAGWPLAVLGRVAGGTTPLVQGQHASLGLGRRGVSVYLGNRSEPTLQMPWQDVTGLFVERPDEVKDRIEPGQLLVLGILAWGLETSEGETFVTVTTKSQDLYLGVQAPVSELRGYWISVLAHFAVDVEEVTAPPAIITLPDPEGDLVARLERLASLHQSGALSEAEYAAAKNAIIQGR